MYISLFFRLANILFFIGQKKSFFIIFRKIFFRPFFQKHRKYRDIFLVNNGFASYFLFL